MRHHFTLGDRSLLRLHYPTERDYDDDSYESGYGCRVEKLAGGPAAIQEHTGNVGAENRSQAANAQTRTNAGGTKISGIVGPGQRIHCSLAANNGQTRGEHHHE